MSYEEQLVKKDKQDLMEWKSKKNVYEFWYGYNRIGHGMAINNIQRNYGNIIQIYKNERQNMKRHQKKMNTEKNLLIFVAKLYPPIECKRQNMNIWE